MMMPIPRGRLLFDTSAYIRFFHQNAPSWLAIRRSRFERTILTAVVAAELYAGTRSTEEKQAVDELCLAHRSLGSFSSPSAELWLEAGVLLGRYARIYGNLRMADHFRDVLIVLEAANNGATLMTANARDFRRWQKLLRSTGRNLRMFDLNNRDSSPPGPE